MREWQEKSLEDIAIINPRESLKKGQVAKKVGMDALQPFTKKIPTYSLEPYSGGTKFRNGDTLVARITPCLENGKTAFVDILDKDEVGYGSTEYIVLREKRNESDKHFLYYLAMSPGFRDIAILSMTGSSGRQRVQTEVVTSYLFEIPPLREQELIAAVLASLDDKIDLLHRQNKTLESLAQTLFRHWFVEGTAVDWMECSLYDAIDLVGGGTPKTSEAKYWGGDISWLSGGDIASNHKNFVVSTEKKITELGLKNSSAKLLPKFSTVISARGTVGKYCILSNPMTFSQSNYGVKPKFESCYFFTYLLIDYSVTDLLSAAYGSVFDTITTRTFQNHQINLPSAAEIYSFEEQITPYFHRMNLNQKQIRTLEKLRDTLLPKLMSGEVRVRL